MTNVSLDLSNKVPKEQVHIIRRVVRTATKLGLSRLFIVGAQARDLILQYAYDLPIHRATNDIDFGIVVETWDEFARLREALITDEVFNRTLISNSVYYTKREQSLISFRSGTWSRRLV